MELDFPPLDCHAHIDPTVTAKQAESLGRAHVFAMTRTLAEARLAVDNSHPGVHWGAGTHPRLKSALDTWSHETFVELASRTFLVGEVGLDAGGALAPQAEVLTEVLKRSGSHLVSVHSSGRVDDVLDCVEVSGLSGVVLHWFTGDQEQVSRAQRLGCFFSVNAAMSDAQIRLIPYENALPETDFPAARARTRATKPGDVRELERRVVRLTQTTQLNVRRHWYSVLGAALNRAGALSSAPKALVELVDRASYTK